MINQKVAVVDIGSNSVRLVVYNGIRRSPTPIFNEKVLCGLASAMAETGRLDKSGAKLAYECIGRFVKLAEVMKVKKLYLFATSAVRDAQDGDDFVKKIEKDYKVKIEILPGEEEAKYAGLGIVSALDHASGVVADLGGGSLELIGIKSGKLFTEGVSYPLGPLRISGDKRKMRLYMRLVKSAFADYDFSVHADENLYLVGGGFRSLAKIHMGITNYPLKVLHDYKIPTSSFVSTLKLLEKMSEKDLLHFSELPSKRAKFLPFVAMLLDQLVEYLKPKELVFSTFGVREGFLYEKLTEAEKQKDGLIEGAIDLVASSGYDPEYGEELFSWIEPLFNYNDKTKSRLLKASCILSDLACYENTEYRGEIAFKRVIDSSLIALNHEERAFIALSLYYRYNSALEGTEITEPIMFLLSKAEIAEAKKIGSAMRLARSLSGSTKGILKNIPISLSKGKIILHFENGYGDLYGEKITKRLAQLGKVLEKDILVRK